MDGPSFTKKSLGQHWLHDQPSLEAMCAAAGLQAGDTVLEIGPGLGTLTRLLTDKTKQVIAVELDEKLASELPKWVQADNLRIVSQDIMRFDFGSLPTGYKLVANIPYYLTSHLIRILSETANPPSTAALLVQKEVAERVAAEPGSMSIISATTQFYWQVSLGRVVPAELFTPPPKVNSQILILVRRPGLLFDDVEPKDFFRIVKAGFAQPRKTLLNNLSAGLQYSRDEAQSVCDRASVDSKRRAQTLSLDEWYRLYRSLHA